MEQRRAVQGTFGDVARNANSLLVLHAALSTKDHVPFRRIIQVSGILAKYGTAVRKNAGPSDRNYTDKLQTVMEGHTCIRPRAIAQRRKRTECSASFTLCMRWLSLLIKLVRRACMWSVPSRLIRGCSFTAKKWVLRMEVSAIICRCVWKGYRKIWFLRAGVSIIMKNEMGSIIARMSPKGSQQRLRSCQQIPKWF